MNPKTVLRQDTLLLYNPKECGERKKDCPFFLLENSRPCCPWGPLDSLSTCLGTDSLILSPECGSDQVHFREDVKTLPQAKKIDWGVRAWSSILDCVRQSSKGLAKGSCLHVPQRYSNLPTNVDLERRCTSSPLTISKLQWSSVFHYLSHPLCGCKSSFISGPSDFSGGKWKQTLSPDNFR